MTNGIRLVSSLVVRDYVKNQSPFVSEQKNQIENQSYRLEMEAVLVRVRHCYFFLCISELTYQKMYSMPLVSIRIKRLHFRALNS